MLVVLKLFREISTLIRIVLQRFQRFLESISSNCNVFSRDQAISFKFSQWMSMSFRSDFKQCLIFLETIFGDLEVCSKRQVILMRFAEASVLGGAPGLNMVSTAENKNVSRQEDKSKYRYCMGQDRGQRTGRKRVDMT